MFKVLQKIRSSPSLKQTPKNLLQMQELRKTIWEHWKFKTTQLWTAK